MLPKELEEVLKEYSPANQEKIRPIWEADTDLQKKLVEQVRAQTDYSRTIQEAKANDAKAKALYASNQEWFRTNADTLDRLEAENASFKTKIAELEKARTGAEGAPSADLAKIDTALADMRKQLADTQKALKDSQDEIGKRFDAGGMWLMEVEAQAEVYRHEFGRSLDRTAFTKYMNENGITDPKKAMESFAKDDRDAKWKEEFKKETRAELEKEIGAKNVPYATGAPFNEKGPLQYYMERPATGPQNTKEGAVAAAAELAAEGKA
jgi:multidrug efflux pump subunit AcrA (membrane-fusion protein)